MKEMLHKQGSNILSGFIVGIIVSLSSISYASLIYNGPLSQYLLYGISGALIASTVITIVLALTSSSKLTIASTQSTFAITAALVAFGLLDTAQKRGVSDFILPTLIAGLLVMGLLLGLSMYFLGVLKMGKLIRYIPFPVIGGFMAGTGWLIFSSAMTLVTDISFLPEYLGRYFSSNVVFTWLLPFLLAVGIIYSKRRFKTPYVFPLALGIALSLFYLYLLVMQIPLQEALHKGWMMGPMPSGNLPMPLATLGMDIHWDIIFYHMEDYFAVIVLAVVNLLLNISSFEMLIKKDMNINQELKMTGVANILSSLLGGFGGYQSLSFSKINFSLGAKARVAGILSGFICLFTLIIGTAFLSYLPKFIFGGILLFIALEFLVEWLIDIKQKISWLDYGIVLAITLAIVFWGLINGITIGLFLSLFIFFFRYSRVSVISSILNGSIIRSNVERNEMEQTCLEQHGKQLLVVQSRGYLFFGNANDMIAQIINSITKSQGLKKLPVKFLIINFSQVTGIEVSGTMSFIKLLHFAQQNQVQVLFTDLPKSIHQEIQRFVSAEQQQLSYQCFHDIDHAIEWCENQLLKKEEISTEAHRDEMLQLTFPEIKNPNILLAYAEKHQFKKGTLVCQEGEQSTDMYWITKGCLDVVLNYNQPTEKRLRQMHSGTLIGEMALFSQSLRSASVIAAEPCEAYRFTLESLKRLSEDYPEISIAFHQGIINILTKRLIHANQLIAAR